MKNIFIGKNGIPYAAGELAIGKIDNNQYLLENYSMRELHDLYTKHYGDYSYVYSNILVAKINVYDKSKDINSFIFKDQIFWFDKNTRMGLMNLANCSNDTLDIVLGNEIITFPTEDFKKFLVDLELYASKCYVQTQNHINSVRKLQTVDEFLKYDYTTGYPEKIVLK